MDKWIIDEIKKRVSVRELAEEAGAEFRGSASRCPLHKGNNPNAFHLRDNETHWHCFTNCPADANDGDVIAFYQYWQHVDFVTAAEALAKRAGIDSAGASKAAPSGGTANPAVPRPVAKPIQAPGPHWQQRAASFVEYAYEQLQGSKVARAYLEHERGITMDTACVWGLGWNAQLWRTPAEHWGITGKPVWLHPGIVIPHFWNGDVCGIKIRVFKEGQAVSEPGGKYRGPRGSVTRGVLFGLDVLMGMPVLVICEGEFDAILSWQMVHDLVDVVGLAGANARLHTTTLLTLAQYAAVIVIVDNDAAGDEARKYWRTIPRVTIVKPPAHDLTDYWKAKGDLRGWLAGQVTLVLGDVLERFDGHEQTTVTQWERVYEQAAGAARG